METSTMPLKWPEILTALDVGASEPVDNTSTVYTAIRNTFTNSDDADMRKRRFTIRAGKVWRLE